MKGGESEVFNLATGRGTSVKDLLNAVSQATGAEVPVQIGARRAGDPSALYASADKACNVLGWSPHYTDIYSIVKTASDWFKRHQN
jgi:UDP-glucose 4-epimerase